MNKKLIKCIFLIALFIGITIFSFIISVNYSLQTNDKYNITNIELKDICIDIIDRTKDIVKINDSENYEPDVSNSEIFNNFPFGCLVKGTKIKIDKNKEKNIENIKVGDSILSYDTFKKDYIKSKVKFIKSYDCIGVYSINDFLKLTEDHPIFIKNKNDKKLWSSINPENSNIYYQYRDVSKLKIGDRIFSPQNGWIKIKKINFLPDKYKVFGLELDNKDHNFIANNFLVSNANYSFAGYLEGVQSLDINNYVILSAKKINAFDDISYDVLRDLFQIPIQYNFKITISYQVSSRIVTTVVEPPDFDYSTYYSYSDYYSFQKQNVLVLPSNTDSLDDLCYGYIYVEVFYL